ncbi:MAG: bacteriohemerythrin [Bacteriovoracaceae bacterium]
MSLMDWNEKLDIGVEEMNCEHKMLLQIMNKLYDDFLGSASYDVLKENLDLLKEKTIEHFQHEEAYMEKINFEGLPGHKFIHKSLLEKFLVFYQEFVTLKKLSEDFFQFLKIWLSAHIQGIDCKYGRDKIRKIA